MSCASQRSDRPSFQARSTAASGASENDATAMPWMSVALQTSASFSAATTASRMKCSAVWPGSGPPRVGRLADADDGGVAGTWSSFVAPAFNVSVPRPADNNSSRRVRYEIRNPRWNEDRLGCPDRDGRRRGAARRRVPAGRRRQISGDPELRPLRQGPVDAGGLQEPVAAHRQGRAGRARRLQQQAPELGAVRPGEMGAGRLHLRAGRFPRRRPLAGLSRNLVAARGQGHRGSASTGPACSRGRTARSACTASRITR